MEGIFDAVVAVVAEAETRGRRIGAGRPRVDAGRHARQLSKAEKARRADFVVRNDGTMEELEDAVREVLKGRLGGQSCAANAVTSRD
jgi:dephospho-CoA kinase